MIICRKSALFSRWFAAVARRRIARSFDSVKVRAVDDLRRLATAHPVLVVSNHTAWWDALLIIDICVRVLRVDAYAVMDARHLTRLPFFGFVGAFGVDPDDPADGARAIRHAARLLDRPGRLVWIFPQGREVPITARPLGFRPGSAEIARLARDAVVVPAAVRYEYGALPKACIYLSFGEPVASTRNVRASMVAHERAVCRELDGIDLALVSGRAEDFMPLHEASHGNLFALATRMLGLLARPRTLR